MHVKEQCEEYYENNGISTEAKKQKANRQPDINNALS